ncbi:RAMP superfamily CRISPR-associated protein [Leptolyngbya sp. 7M]|uniref:RAMP superfamily CRISPR-associated protein n=1 Tax=Leptolyngbya sp. 7M TaxID=2812896 RepID=UPI001B8C2CC1|nr:RAMP superfamily CRISPR-associated protein [Leptolyngbya sp. 7M]QYO68152.1 CRISPR-associated protein [Leptolyngbya sp. 7M]
MHKRLVNHCTIELSIIPNGPILIKSGKEGADPTKPDMEFVETYHQGGRSVYLPGSSLKGAIRAHAERIVRTVGSEQRKQDDYQHLWASNPLQLNDYDYLKNYSETHDIYKTHNIYKWSSFTDQMFGSTAIASRIRIEDAYPDPEAENDPNRKLKLEERNGVAIDRVFGSVAVGPFNYQVCTRGEFCTKIHLKNFTLAQLGLVGLVLRDLNDGWFGLGFAKSRGLGTVQVKLKTATVQYPGCVLGEDNRIHRLGSSQRWEPTTLLGAGAFFDESKDEEKKEREAYGFLSNDLQSELSVTAEAMELGFGVQLIWQGKEQVKDLFMRAVKAWSGRVAR